MRTIRFLTTTLLVALSFVFVQSAAYAQESKVDMTKCITLTVKQGVKIKMAFAASTDNVWVKVIGVKNEKEEKAPTYLNFDQQEYEASGTEVKVYGAIDRFHCDENKENLTALDVSQNTQLTELWCAYNQLRTLDLSKNAQLTELRCVYNQLSTLDVSKNTQLTELHCLENQLTTLDVSANTQLTKLDCRNNKLTTLDVSKNTQLTKLWCAYNQLSTLDVSQNTLLTELDCNSNQLCTLDVSKNTQLKELNCRYNQLSMLDVSQNTLLTELNCDSNQLRTLDVSQNTLLTELNCESNQLCTLDVSQNKKLKKLKLYDNLFSTSALNVIYCQLPDRKSETEKGKINLAYKKGDVTDEVLTKSSSGQIAKGKNWAIQYDRNDTDIEGIEGHFICEGSSKLTLVPATKSQPFPCNGGEWTTTVTSTGDWKIDETVPLPYWLEITPKQGSNGAQVTIKAKPNDASWRKKDALIFVLTNEPTTKEVIILAQQPLSISVTPSEGYTFPAAGETKENYFTVESTGAWKVTSSNAEWFPVETKEGGTGTTQVTIKADANNSATVRQTTLTFALKDTPSVKQDVEVKQEGSSSSIKVKPSEGYTFPAAGETKENYFTVESTGAWKVTSSNAEWFPVETKEGGMGTTQITIKADANNSATVRQTTLTFALKDTPRVKQDVVVKQGGSSSIKVKPSEGYTFPAAGETKENYFTVESTGAWKVTSSNAEWFPVEMKEGGTGTTQVTIKADANNSATVRQITLTFALKDTPRVKQDVVVKQEANPNAVEDAVFANVIVSPNPFGNELRIKNEELRGKYALLNTKGVVLLSGSLGNGETIIKTATFPTGIYLLQLTTENGATKTITVAKDR